jgi:hypothetical protein
MQALTQRQEAQAYMAEPPLVKYMSVPSTVDYSTQNHNLTAEEQQQIAKDIGV